MMEEVKESESPKQTTVVSLPVKQYAIVKCIQDKLNDQDFMQKVGMAPVVALEMYRVIVSSFLVLFVPQKCDDHVCTLSENMVLEHDLYNAGLVFNFLTMAAFLAMYTLEVKRENRLITYLEVNKGQASDNASVGLALEKLPLDKRDSIWELDKYYIYSGWTAIVMFIINTILSGFVVYEYYLDSQTTSTYITNILFMVTKLLDVHSNVNTEKNVFYSAYLKGKVQYNDVDPDKAALLKIEDEKKEYFAVPGVSGPEVSGPEVPSPEVSGLELAAIKTEEEKESGKIVVINYDISSNPSSPISSSNDLQKLDP